jgi:hypothetical protein
MSTHLQIELTDKSFVEKEIKWNIYIDEYTDVLDKLLIHPCHWGTGTYLRQRDYNAGGHLSW